MLVDVAGTAVCSWGECLDTVGVFDSRHCGVSAVWWECMGQFYWVHGLRWVGARAVFLCRRSGLGAVKALRCPSFAFTSFHIT